MIALMYSYYLLLLWFNTERYFVKRITSKQPVFKRSESKFKPIKTHLISGWRYRLNSNHEIYKIGIVPKHCVSFSRRKSSTSARISFR